MNKTAVKNYAIWARVQLIESCKQRAFEHGVTEDGNYASNLRAIGSRILTDREVEQRNQLIGQIRQKGYAQVMEEAAYTWFNRFIALRFMEVNGYLPSKVRVFTDETGAFKPEIIKEAMTIELEGIDRATIINLLEKQDNEALYKYLLITQCNALSTGLPYMFEKISNWTELLFPANLLRIDSVVGRMVTDIPEEDWTDAVQIIGWLYQYYNSELKDETFALLKKNVKITKERIPAATQLFTPDWIVRYMVENSLGRLWYEGHKDFDKSQWKYYLEEAEQEPEVEAELSKIREEYSQIKPEEIKVIDPCMGSGHILVYAFDVLMQIYTSAGWSERDAARSIIENNLYGLDIDDRAGQLAYFAVMMKARKYSRRIMSLEIKPNVMSIQDSSFMENELIDFVAGNDATIKAGLRRIKEVFTDAKEYGSILNVPSLGYEEILERIDEIQKAIVEDIFHIEYRNVAIEQLRPLVMQAMIMSQKYDVVVTNPPYMVLSGGNNAINSFVKNNYPDSKYDMFAVFIEKCCVYADRNSLISMITQQSWMFQPSFNKLRKKLHGITIKNLLHLGSRAFDEIGGEVVQTAAFSILNTDVKDYLGCYIRLTDPAGERNKETAFFNRKNTYYCNKEVFLNLPNNTIAYWLSEHFIKVFEHERINKYAISDGQNKTGDNEKYMRCLWEIDSNKVGKQKKWALIAKGGRFRKWYGNIEVVVNWSPSAQSHYRKDKVARISPEYIWFRLGVSWNHIASNNFAARLLRDDMLFETAAPSIFFDDLEKVWYVLAYLNSTVSNNILKFVNPTLSTNVGDITVQPLVESIDNERVVNLSKDCVHLSRCDWDAFETSHEFMKHPLV